MDSLWGCLRRPIGSAYLTFNSIVWIHKVWSWSLCLQDWRELSIPLYGFSMIGRIVAVDIEKHRLSIPLYGFGSNPLVPHTCGVQALSIPLYGFQGLLRDRVISIEFFQFHCMDSGSQWSTESQTALHTWSFQFHCMDSNMYWQGAPAE